MENYNGISRIDVINRLIESRGYKSYLEVGVEFGQCFNSINIENKTGVDPDISSAATVKMTSDEFFATIAPDVKYDIIFIDGLHEYEQCYRDIVNATKHLNKGGIILCHDMNPLSETWIDCRPNAPWTGDVYKSLIRFRAEHRDFSSCLLYDTDYGIGVIMEGVGTKVECDLTKLTYNEWENNKQYLMNCMTWHEFNELFL